MAQGQILLADLHRISKELPQALRWGALMEGRYAPILFDYRYFKERTALEQKIEASTDLQQLDDHFREVRYLIGGDSVHDLASLSSDIA